MAGVAGAIVRYKIKPKTPELTGLLVSTVRSSSRVNADGNIEMTFMATAPYAMYLELEPYIRRIKHLTKPGSRVPFLEPGVREGTEAYLPGGVKEMFGG